jgi:tetratricopeptide (TPR) repeat protein
MRSRGLKKALLGAAVMLAVAGGAAAGIRTLWLHSELRLARAELARGMVLPARKRLSLLAAAHPGALGGRVDYELGLAEAAIGNSPAALDAFGRLPDGYPFDARGAIVEARANLERGRLRLAESRLEQAISRGGSPQEMVELRQLLVRVYQIQIRFDEAIDLLRSGILADPDPEKALDHISLLERRILPLESLRTTLEEAYRLAPEDDRVWLGRGRLAILAGDPDTAIAWLVRCHVLSPDAAVWRAWIDLDRVIERTSDVRDAVLQLRPGDLTESEQCLVRAWLAEQAGDRPAEARAWNDLLRLRPGELRAWERLAALALADGDDARAAQLRGRKGELDRALERYRGRVRDVEANRTHAGRLEMAQLAEAASRPEEARIWRELARRNDAGPGPPRLDVRPDVPRPSESAWRSFQAEVAGLARAATARRSNSTLPSDDPASGLAFGDDADPAGLRFVYENGPTPQHQVPETMGGGAGLLDYDGDGWLDLYVVQGGAFPPSPDRPSPGDRLFRNRQGRDFEDVTAAAGIAALPQGYGHGVAVGDYDGDGHPDLFLTRWRAYALFRNQGDGTFRDVTSEAGLDGDRDWPTSAAFADLDADGDLDLYVAHYAVWDTDNPLICRQADTGAIIICDPLRLQARPDHLFRNDGGRFADVSDEAGITAADTDGRGLGVVAADFDADGLTDLYVANDATANFLFRNRGGLRFEEAAHEAGCAGSASGGYQASMGVAAGDLDGDGRLDLAVTNFYGEGTTFYQNLGSGLFADRTEALGMLSATRSLLGFGITAFDADNDGRLDLATANGHVNDLRPHFPHQMPAQLLMQSTAGRFTDASRQAGSVWNVPRMARALAAGDLDNDGRTDLVIVSHQQPLAYFHNQTSPPGHFVTLRLVGTQSNRDGVGAVVTVRAGGRRQVQHRIGGGSYQSAGDPRLCFGLGDAPAIETLEVAWPSGHRQRWEGLPGNTGYLVREDAPAPQPLAGFSTPLPEAR